MAKIITVGNQKGGVGKSTICALLANALAAAPFSLAVTVLDVDAQRSLLRQRLADLEQYKGKTPYPIEAATIEDVKHNLPALDKSQDVVLIDAPGRLDSSLPGDQQIALQLVAISDVLLIPFVPGNFALESSLDFLKAALKTKAARANDARPLAVIGLVNMFEGSRTNDDKFLLDELTELRSLVNIPFVGTELNRYALFRITDTLESYYQPGSADKARQNFTLFIDELAQLLQLAG
jgi:cellulose biosynthesis protein BcsQ